jgi:SAM-dependent methyltransferase
MDKLEILEKILDIINKLKLQSIIFVAIDIIIFYKSNERIHSKPDFLRIVEERNLNPKYLLESLLVFSLTISKNQLKFLKYHYCKDFFRKTFLNEIDGFKFENDIANKYYFENIKERELYDFLSNYHRYALGLIEDNYNPSLQTSLRKKTIFDFLDDGKGKLLIDIGCGVFSWFSEYEKRNYNSFGYNLSHIQLKAANFIQPKTLKKVVCSSAEELPLKTGSVDVIVASEVLEHLINPIRFLEEAKRCLVEGGYLVLTVPIRTQFQFSTKRMDNKRELEFNYKMKKHPYSKLLKISEFYWKDEIDATHNNFFIPELGKEEERFTIIKDLFEPLDFAIDKVQLRDVIGIKLKKGVSRNDRIKRD